MTARILGSLLALLVGASSPGCVLNATRPIPAPPPAAVAVTAFDASLAPYGDFVVVAKVGRVWRPHLAVVGAGFVPYATGGRWVLTSQGWVFESRWDFGWAVFHYGHWMELADLGWVWMPGGEWASAWVEWEVGGGYVAWAPMPPPGLWIDWRPRWCFAEARWLAEGDWIDHHLLPHTFRPVAPVVMTRVVLPPGRPVAFGPPVDYVHHSSGIPVRIHEVTPPPPAGIGRTRVHDWSPLPPAVMVPPPPPGQPAPRREEPPAVRPAAPAPAPVVPRGAPVAPPRHEPVPPAVKPPPPATPAPPPGQPQKKHQRDDERAPRAALARGQWSQGSRA